MPVTFQSVFWNSFPTIPQIGMCIFYELFVAFASCVFQVEMETEPLKNDLKSFSLAKMVLGKWKIDRIWVVCSILFSKLRLTEIIILILEFKFTTLTNVLFWFELIFLRRRFMCLDMFWTSFGNDSFLKCSWASCFLDFKCFWIHWRIPFLNLINR